jgi:hypothetical protein
MDSTSPTKLSNLKTMAEVMRDRPRAQPKGTRADRAVAEAKADTADAAALDKWKKAVRLRDKGCSRLTGKTLKVTMEFKPDRGEAHHIVGRADRKVRTDRRNGVYLALTEHDRAERGLLKIEGTQFFEVDGRRYIDADEPLKFTDTDTGEVVIR